jgi:hypothetical protein
MINNLREFIFKGHATRWRACLCSAVLTAFSGGILESGFKFPISVASRFAALVGLASFALFALGYRARATIGSTTPVRSHQDDRFTTRRFASGLAGAVVLFLFGPLSSGVEAAILDRKLLSLAGYSPSTAERARQILAEAEKHKIKLPIRSVSLIGDGILHSALHHPATTDWGAVGQLATYRSFLNASSAAKKRFQAFEVIGEFGPESHGIWIEYPKDKGVAFVNQTFILDGHLDELNILVDDAGHPARLYANIVFRSCLIKYRGGPITLRNVFFESCRFEILPSVNGAVFARGVFENAVTDLVIGSQVRQE